MSPCRQGQQVQNSTDAPRAAGGVEIGTHTLRHSYARHLLMNGTQINYLSRWLGHSSSQTTLTYLELVPDPSGGLDRAPWGLGELIRWPVLYPVLNSHTTIWDTAVLSSGTTQSKVCRTAGFCPLAFFSDVSSSSETLGIDVVVTGVFAKKPISLQHGTRRYL